MTVVGVTYGDLIVEALSRYPSREAFAAGVRRLTYAQSAEIVQYTGQHLLGSIDDHAFVCDDAKGSALVAAEPYADYAGELAAKVAVKRVVVLPAPVGASLRSRASLPTEAFRVVGPPVAKYLAFTGELLPAADLVPFGLVNEVVDDDSLELRVAELAEQMARKSSTDLAHMKRLIDDGLEQPLVTALRLEQQALPVHVHSADIRGKAGRIPRTARAAVRCAITPPDRRARYSGTHGVSGTFTGITPERSADSEVNALCAMRPEDGGPAPTSTCGSLSEGVLPCPTGSRCVRGVRTA